MGQLWYPVYTVVGGNQRANTCHVLTVASAHRRCSIGEAILADTVVIFIRPYLLPQLEEGSVEDTDLTTS